MLNNLVQCFFFFFALTLINLIKIHEKKINFIFCIAGRVCR